MAATTTEIMMQFIGDDGALDAECGVAIDDGDKLACNPLSGYADGFLPGCYFLVENFRLGLSLNDSETAKSQAPPPQAAPLRGSLRPAPPPPAGRAGRIATAAAAAAGTPAAPAKTSSAGQFKRWRAAADKWDPKQGNQQTYNARMEDFSFTRRMDIASVQLFDYWQMQRPFQFASIIKRKSVPLDITGQFSNRSYLRIDFADPVIASLQWSDDDVVEERCTFRATRVMMVYWTEESTPNADAGSDLRPYGSAEWLNTAVDEGDDGNGG